MELIAQQFPIVIHSLNIGFLQTLKLFFITLLGALPLGLVIMFGSMSHFRPLRYFVNFVVWIVRGTPLMIQDADHLLFSRAGLSQCHLGRR